ncbi:cilia- and flagella-associated protein 44 isoform X2 [Brachyhypopomus gauderio]|uniref:cilia- and flagella-associated protein 44 isoform X2 n=1 Tax=Brachyhypopomus gauderio TaxID=698409 RepID=UPI004040FD13
MDSSEDMAGELTLPDYPPAKQDALGQSGDEQGVEVQTDSAGSGSIQPPANVEVFGDVEISEDLAGEGEEKQERLAEDLYYDYEELCSKAFTTTDSNIPQGLMQLSHSFGYDCKRRANLHLLDERTLAFVAGNVLVLSDVRTKEQRYVRSCSGGGIGAIMTHPSKRYLAVGEKGELPNIIIYEYPSLRPYRLLRGGTGRAYSFVNFNREGNLLASVGTAPDYMLTLWDWREEQVVLRCKAFSQDIYRVTFSPDNPGQLTTSGSGHIKFWKMADTFTGLKLQGMLGRFGKTALTDIEGYVELPDGKVVSGSEWGNMLLWDGGLIKVEICRKEGRTCHAGTIQQFVLEEGELMTAGTDGAVRFWDFETIDTADCVDDSGLFELEPMNEVMIGRNVSLYSMVKSSEPDSTIWFAQDSNGGIWKLDLSLSNTIHCLSSYHAGAIEGLDVSDHSHLMATTALDRSVRIFDYLSQKELTSMRFKQGGTSLTWAPHVVPRGEGLLAVGFEDGVVRLLELYDPQRLRPLAGSSHSGDAELRLKQAFKPHNATVTAISFERNGEKMATGSLDCTVFFFAVGDKYEPIGFISVPGPVQDLQWSPQSHERNSLLVACQTGHVVEIEAPAPGGVKTDSTFLLQNLPISHFCFHSIRSRVERDAEIALRQAVKEKKKKESENRMRKAEEAGREPTEEELQDEGEEEEAELPPIYIPSPPSPLLCIFYSEPGAFWLSMGGYDSGYLYHCKFSEQTGVDPTDRSDEPFSSLPIQGGDHNPILSVCFNPSRTLLLCGMQDGSVRAYPVESGQAPPGTMGAYWALNLHDNQSGGVRQLRSSHDGRFLLSAGADGNIFSLSVVPEDQLQDALRRGRATLPSPRPGLEAEPMAFDIEDPAAYSIETAKQRLELDRLQREADQRKQDRHRRLAELRSRFQALLQLNQSLPAHARLPHTDFELDPCFREEAERRTEEQVREVKQELSWEEERHRVGLHKVQHRFWDSLECDTVTVSAFASAHKLSTYRLLARSSRTQGPCERGPPTQAGGPGAQEQQAGQKDTSDDIIKEPAHAAEPAVPQRKSPRAGTSTLAGRQAEKLRKASEKAERARAKIEKRKREWAELYATKPSEDSEDPEDVRAIRLAAENLGDLKLKTAKDFTVPEHLRTNMEKKTVELATLELQIYQKKSEMNARVLALRDSKVELISQLHLLSRQLLALQGRLPPEKRRPPPLVPAPAPEETPERRLSYTHHTLQRYAALRAQADQQGEPQDVLEVLWQEEKEKEEEEARIAEEYGRPRGCSGAGKRPEGQLSELEQEVLEVEEIQNLYLQDVLLKQMEELMWRFDAELRILRAEKVRVDVQMKMADLQHVTLLEELLILNEFEKRDKPLQERLMVRVQEEKELRLKLEECKQQLEVKQRDIAKLQERERGVASSFQTSLEENNTFADFLTRVFRKKIKRKKDKTDGEEEDSDEDSEEESEWDDDEDDEGSEGTGALNDSVCPPNCDQQLFEDTLKLREHRLDVEELLVEQRRCAEALKKERDSLAKKEKIVQSNLQAAEGDVELFNREKQQKLNELDVVVPLKLHQIELVSNGVLPAKLTSALVLNAAGLGRLHGRIKELQQEKQQQGELYRQARQRHAQLSLDRRDMEARIQELEARCEKMMMLRFGQLVDMEVLQTLSGSRTLEEMKQKNREREDQYRHELQIWQEKVAVSRQVLTDVTREETKRMKDLTILLTQQKLLEDKLNTPHRKMGSQFQGRRQAEEDERLRLQQLIQSQKVQLASLRHEINVLSHKGGAVLPPAQPPLPPRSAAPHLPHLPHLPHAHGGEKTTI